MNDEALKALQGSIAKWEAIVAGTGEDKGWKNCPLCILFNNADGPRGGLGCSGCPVADAGHRFCDNSPYDIWNAKLRAGQTRMAVTPELKQSAQAELDFLRSLLPAPTVTSPVEAP